MFGITTSLEFYEKLVQEFDDLCGEALENSPLGRLCRQGGLETAVHGAGSVRTLLRPILAPNGLGGNASPGESRRNSISGTVWAPVSNTVASNTVLWRVAGW